MQSFISHRTGEILENSIVSQWRWLPSKQNVADEATRDDKGFNININSRWFKGPEFLYQPIYFWPMEENFNNCFTESNQKTQNKNECILLISNVAENTSLPDITKFSKWKFYSLCVKVY